MKNLAIFLILIMLTITFTAPSVLAGVDRCLSLDGNGDYVDLGQNTFNNLDDFTIEMWGRLDEYYGGFASFFYGGNLDTGNPVIEVTLAYRYLLFRIAQAGGERHGIEETKHFLPLGQWFHAAAVFDKAGSGMALYANGELVGTNSYNTQSFSDFAGFDLTYLIGHHGGWGFKQFKLGFSTRQPAAS